MLIKSGHLCEECGQRQLDRLVFVSGEPRNIALIAHWDGWQSFGSPGRHSCGKCLQNISIYSSTIVHVLCHFPDR